MKSLKNKNIVLGIIGLIVILFLLNNLNILSITGTIGTNEVKKIYEDEKSITYRITASRDGYDPFIDSSGVITNLGFGATTSSDSPLRSDDLNEGKMDVVSKKYSISSSMIKINGGLSTINNLKGYCIPFGTNQANDVSCDPKQFIDRYDNGVLCKNCREVLCRPQSLTCEIEEGIVETMPDGGIYSISIETTVLKKGVECTENQMINCPSNSICSVDNKCVPLGNDNGNEENEEEEKPDYTNMIIYGSIIIVGLYIFYVWRSHK